MATGSPKEKDYVPLAADPKILELLEWRKRQLEADKRYLESLEFKREITKGEIMKLFRVERAAIHDLLSSLDTEFYTLTQEAHEDAKLASTAKGFCNSLDSMLKAPTATLQEIELHMERIAQGIGKL